MISIKQILQKPKIKFWIIGTVVALTGVFAFRVGFQLVGPDFGKFVKYSGLAVAIIGLYIVMLGIERKVK